jgi:hypothetical protein
VPNVSTSRNPVYPVSLGVAPGQASIIAFLRIPSKSNPLDLTPQLPG